MSENEKTEQSNPASTYTEMPLLGCLGHFSLSAGHHSSFFSEADASQSDTDFKPDNALPELSAPINEVSQNLCQSNDSVVTNSCNKILTVQPNQDEHVQNKTESHEGLKTNTSESLESTCPKPQSSKKPLHQKQPMSKNQKKSNVNENMERINYLVQVSKLTAAEGMSEMSAVLGSRAIAIGRKTQVRLSSSLKREICKGCGIHLIAGVNARFRHRSKRQKHLVVTCLMCNTIKRFVNNPNHKLWCDHPESHPE